MKLKEKLKTNTTTNSFTSLNSVDTLKKSMKKVGYKASIKKVNGVFQVNTSKGNHTVKFPTWGI